MSERVSYRHLNAPTECLSCLAWYCEYQRIALLFETLAEDHFPDQATMDLWIARQMSNTLRARTPESHD